MDVLMTDGPGHGLNRDHETLLATQASSSPLLDLPVELRLKIFEYVLPPAKQEIRMCASEEHSEVYDWLRVSLLQLGTYDGYRGSTCTGSGGHDSRQCPGIVSVNRQIHKECVSILQKITQFRFGTLPCLHTFLENLTDNHRALITKLSVQTSITAVSIYDHYDYKEDIGPISEFVWKTRVSCGYFSRRGWSRVLAANKFLDYEHDDIVFTLSTTKTSEEEKRKNVEDDLTEDDCKIGFGELIVHGFLEDDLDSFELDCKWAAISFDHHEPEV
ncbi:hypothetical protein H2200_009419 [Cladophialophora chaetospira]|uniref:DUF7730 domain-containing protein n=1 Tax=Cladophialophora chaetospira TaxID=386627 RepID=A0AA39CFC6_9EURO|nr:hypothetical protein H2200_009419 [Cladophialophora chaetospira]